MRSVAVVPSEVELEFAFECHESIGNESQPTRALGFDGSNTPLDHRQAPILPRRPEVTPNAVATTPPEFLFGELLVIVEDEVSRPVKIQHGRRHPAFTCQVRKAN